MESALDECPKPITDVTQFQAELMAAADEVRWRIPGSTDGFIRLKTQFHLTPRGFMEEAVRARIALRIRETLLLMQPGVRAAMLMPDEASTDGYGDIDASPHHSHAPTRLAR